MIELGSKVRDIYSGFTGIAIARTEKLYGAIEVQVDPCLLSADSGLPLSAIWIEEPRLEVLITQKPKIGFQGRE